MSYKYNERSQAWELIWRKNLNLGEGGGGSGSMPPPPHPPLLHRLTRVHTPLLSHLNWSLGPAMYAIKIKNCNIMKPCADVFQASFPHKLSLSAQLVFLFHKVIFIILKSMSLFGVVQQFKKKKKKKFFKLHMQSGSCTVKWTWV